MTEVNDNPILGVLAIVSGLVGSILMWTLATSHDAMPILDFLLEIFSIISGFVFGFVIYAFVVFVVYENT